MGIEDVPVRLSAPNKLEAGTQNEVDCMGRVPGDTFTFAVTDIVKEGAIYDPNANIETEDSISVP